MRPLRLVQNLPRRSFVVHRKAAFATRVPPDPHSNAKRQPQNSGSSPVEPAEAPASNSLSEALKNAKTEDNNLLSPVHIPEDPNGVLNERHPAAKILANSAVVVQRQLEMMNIMLGFEQANKYLIMDPNGNHLGYMAEQEFGMGNMMARQTFRTHRSFTTHVFDKHEKEVLRFHRPFSWVSSRIRVYDPLEVVTSSRSTSTAIQSTKPGSLSSELSGTPVQISPLALSDMRIVGEAQQYWAPLRRKYNLFVFRGLNVESAAAGTAQLTSGNLPMSDSKQLQASNSTEDNRDSAGYEQFAYVDEPFLSWDFSLLSADSRLLGSVNRSWGGFGREIFTDTGAYALRMDAAGLVEEPRHLISKTGQKNPVAYDQAGPGMTLDQRAVMLATAVSIDFDYFSRQRGGVVGGWMPLWFPMGTGTAEGAAGAGAAEAGAGAIGGVARGAGVAGAEGAAVGAGTMAGYEAMHRPYSGSGDDASPVSSDPGFGAGQAPPPPGQDTGMGQQQEEVWGEDNSPWNDDSPPPSGGGGGGGGEGGGGGFDIGDWF